MTTPTFADRVISELKDRLTREDALRLTLYIYEREDGASWQDAVERAARVAPSIERPSKQRWEREVEEDLGIEGWLLWPGKTRHEAAQDITEAEKRKMIDDIFAGRIRGSLDETGERVVFDSEDVVPLEDVTGEEEGPAPGWGRGGPELSTDGVCLEPLGDLVGEKVPDEETHGGGFQPAPAEIKAPCHEINTASFTTSQLGAAILAVLQARPGQSWRMDHLIRAVCAETNESFGRVSAELGYLMDVAGKIKRIGQGGFNTEVALVTPPVPREPNEVEEAIVAVLIEAGERMQPKKIRQKVAKQLGSCPAREFERAIGVLAKNGRIVGHGAGPARRYALGRTDDGADPEAEPAGIVDLTHGAPRRVLEGVSFEQNLSEARTKKFTEMWANRRLTIETIAKAFGVLPVDAIATGRAMGLGYRAVPWRHGPRGEGKSYPVDPEQVKAFLAEKGVSLVENIAGPLRRGSFKQ